MTLEELLTRRLCSWVCYPLTLFELGVVIDGSCGKVVRTALRKPSAAASVHMLLLSEHCSVCALRSVVRLRAPCSFHLQEGHPLGLAHCGQQRAPSCQPLGTVRPDRYSTPFGSLPPLACRYLGETGRDRWRTSKKSANLFSSASRLPRMRCVISLHDAR